MLADVDAGLRDAIARVAFEKFNENHDESPRMKAVSAPSLADLNYTKTETGYRVKALDDETIHECATRYDAMNALREEVVKTMTADSVHHDSTAWAARDLREKFDKAIKDDKSDVLNLKHEALHALPEDEQDANAALLHHMICHADPKIECDGGTLTQPVILGSHDNVEINEAIAQGLVDEADGQKAIDDGITHADIVHMMDHEGTYTVVIPIVSEEKGQIMKKNDIASAIGIVERNPSDIAKALGFNDSGLVISLVDFIKAGTPKLLTEIVDDGKPDQYTLAPYYIPNTLDGHKEWVETRDLDKAVNEWSLMSPNRNVFLQHDENIVAGTWTQLIVMPWEFDAELKSADGSLKKHHFPVGTVLIGVVWKDWAWEMILDGKITGMSMGGMAMERKDTPPPTA